MDQTPNVVNPISVS